MYAEAELEESKVRSTSAGLEIAKTILSPASKL